MDKILFKFLIKSLEKEIPGKYSLNITKRIRGEILADILRENLGRISDRMHAYNLKPPYKLQQESFEKFLAKSMTQVNLLEFVQLSLQDFPMESLVNHPEEIAVGEKQRSNTCTYSLAEAPSMFYKLSLGDALLKKSREGFPAILGETSKEILRRISAVLLKVLLEEFLKYFSKNHWKKFNFYNFSSDTHEEIADKVPGGFSKGSLESLKTKN